MPNGAPPRVSAVGHSPAAIASYAKQGYNRGVTRDPDDRAIDGAPAVPLARGRAHNRQASPPRTDSQRKVPMMSAKLLLILVVALLLLAKVRVAVAPGLVVPVPVVFLAGALAVTAFMVALIVARVRADRYPGPGTAVRVLARETAAS